MTSKEYIQSMLKAKRADLSAKGIREVGLFGSYARNEQTELSDIDILVDFDPEKETFDNYMAVMRCWRNFLRIPKWKSLPKMA